MEKRTRGVSVDSELLDLSFLSEEERTIIQGVLARDALLQTEDQIRLGTLRQKVAVARSRQKELLNVGQCTVCGKKFGVISSCDKQCLVCNYKVCENCRHHPVKPPPDFMCLVCYKTGVLHIQSSPSTSERILYGSDLVKRSLTTLHKEASPVQLLNVSERGRSHSLTPILPAELAAQDHESITGYPSSLVVRSSDPTPSSDNHDNPLPTKKVTDFGSNEEEGQGKTDSALLSSTLSRSGSIGSFTSTTSLYSAAGVTKGDYDITGEVLLGVELQKQQLLIHISRARGLAMANKKNLSNPYIKTYLLPDRSKRSKRKTKPKRRTVDPVYDETLKYKLRGSDCSSFTVWLSVWDYDRFGRNKFLGEVYLELATMDLTDAQPRWYNLMDRQLEDLQREVRGGVRIRLMFKPDQERGTSTRGDLYVTVDCARLIVTHPPPDAFVTCHLLPDRRKTDKLKTRVVSHSSTPKWNEEMVFVSLSIEELTKERVLELTIWDYNVRYSNDFLGGLRLGPFAPGRKEWMDCVGEEVTHWQAMLNHHGKWVESWHPLRSNMDPRDVNQIEVGDTVRLPPSISEVIEEEEDTRGDPRQASRLPPEIIFESESESEEEKKSTVTEDEESEGAASFTLLVPPTIGHSVSGSSFGSYASSASSKDLHKGSYEITGEVLAAVEQEGQNLLIHVNKAKGLAAADKNGLSDPYVKTYLLPERRTSRWKRKTALKKKTLNPVYNETLKYKLPTADFSHYTIWLSVWDHDVFGKNSFLGEVFIPLSKLNLAEDTYKQWYTLKDHAHFPHLPSGHTIQHAAKDTTEPSAIATTTSTKDTTEPSAIAATTSTKDTTEPSAIAPQSTESQPVGDLTHQPNTPPTNDDHEENLSTIQPHPPVGADSKQDVVEEQPVVLSQEKEGQKDSSNGFDPDTLSSTRSSIPNVHSIQKRPSDSPVSPQPLTGSPSVPSTTTPGAAIQRLSETNPVDIVSAASFDSSFSLESSMEIHKGPYEISGEVLVGVEVKDQRLLIQVSKARGLAAAGRNGLSDPYVKTYLLPDTSQRSKRKTTIKKKTLEPVYNETLKYRLSSTDYSQYTIWLSVWDYDRFGRNSFLGEFHLPLSMLNLNDPQQHWYPLKDRVDEESLQKALAELEVALCTTPDTKNESLCSLALNIQQARNLALLMKKSSASVYVKCYLLPDRTASKRRTKTCSYHQNSPTVWKEQLVYEKLDRNKLAKERALEVSVWSSHRGSSNELIGKFCLGPSSANLETCSVDEISHWEEVFSKPGEWITYWHPLRNALEPKGLAS